MKLIQYKYLAATALLFVVTLGNVYAQTFNVKSYGAAGDGITNDQVAIQKAIDACKAKGGTVVLANGTYLTGQLQLVSNMTLKIEAGATLLGMKSDEESVYPHGIINTRYLNRMEQDCQRRLIYGDHVENVTITGGGTLNGQGDYEPWMHVKDLGTEKDRPSILAFVGCKNITVSGLTLLNPACWTQVYIESDDIHVQGITVNTGRLTPNRDGIDIVDCHNVLIEDSSFSSEDDGICFKSGSEYGCKDVVVRNCTIDKLGVPAGNGFKLGTDGLGSFVNFEISGLTVKNVFQNSAFALESVDGAIIDNINIHDCTIENSAQAFFIILGNRKRTVKGRQPRIGAISNIFVQNIKGSGFTQQYPSIITGMERHYIQNLLFKNVDFILKGGINTKDQTVPDYDGTYPEGSKFGVTNGSGFYLRYVEEASFIDCTFKTDLPDARYWLAFKDVVRLIY